jgi:hypothetical protein
MITNAHIYVLRRWIIIMMASAILGEHSAKSNTMGKYEGKEAGGESMIAKWRRLQSFQAIREEGEKRNKDLKAWLKRVRTAPSSYGHEAEVHNIFLVSSSIRWTKHTFHESISVNVSFAVSTSGRAENALIGCKGYRLELLLFGGKTICLHENLHRRVSQRLPHTVCGDYHRVTALHLTPLTILSLPRECPLHAGILVGTAQPQDLLCLCYRTATNVFSYYCYICALILLR